MISNTKEINIWAMPIHVNERNKQVQSFEFCLKKGILGIGWETTKSIKGLNSNFNEFVEKYSKFIGTPSVKSFIQIVNKYNEIKVNDLIWTRSGNNYYLCRFLGEKNDYFRNMLSDEEIEEHTKYDIWHGLKCEIIYVGTADKVTGTVQDIFCAGGIRRFVKNLDETKLFSMNTYNKLICKKYYACEFRKDLQISNLHSDDLEELVITYLQMKYNYAIYSNTCKSNTKTYECVLFDKNSFNNIYVQVKSGLINLKKDDYKNIYLNSKFYFYSSTNEYKGYEKNENIIIIETKELEKFLNNNLKLKDKYII